MKHSGYGRELSYLGIREFMNIQTVWVGPAEVTTRLQASRDGTEISPEKPSPS